MGAHDTSRCPLCGEANACTRAAVTEGDDIACWCFDVHVPRGLLAMVPADARGERCVCRTCIGVHRREPGALLERGRQLLARLRTR